MNSLTRLLPYFLAHRGKIALSAVFALLVAVFWGMNLSVAYPIVKVLLQKQDLTEYVEQEIAVAQRESDSRSAKLTEIDAQLERLERAGPAREEERVAALKRQAREQSLLTDVSHRLLVLNWVKSSVLPWLPRDQFDMLALILGLLIVATLAKGICLFIQEVLVGSVVELIAIDIRKACFRHTLKLDYQTLYLAGTPDLMSRFTNDLNQLTYGLSLLAGKVIREPLKALACLTVAFWVNWRLTLLSMVFVPLAAIIFHRIGRKLKQASHRLMESMSRIYKTLEETLDGLKIVIAFNGARAHRQRFHRDNKEYFAKALRLVKIDALTSPTVEVLGVLAAFIALLPGAYLVLRETTHIWEIKLASTPMEIAELTTLYVLLAGMIDPARKLSSVYGKLKRATAAADRIFALIDRKPLVAQTPEPKVMPRHARSIEFRKITFSYAGSRDDVQARPPVLDEVSFKVRHGEVIVVVGENGSGKSTLVNLLPRFYDPDVGSVLIDGVDIRDVRLRELRNQIGVVTQETLLFDDTIYANILYGKPSATRDEVEAAARQAHVTSFVEQLPDGFDTRVGERGGRLSGGQRQRIALARAILRDPTVLILDEATSAIDSASELLIHQTLREFSRGRTVLIITHTVSQSILDFVSRIAVMDHGRLIAAGPHEMLLETCPVYQKLYQSRVQQPAAALEGDEEEPDESQSAEIARASAAGSPHIFRIPEQRQAADRRTGDAAGF